MNKRASISTPYPYHHMPSVSKITILFILGFLFIILEQCHGNIKINHDNMIISKRLQHLKTFQYGSNSNHQFSRKSKKTLNNNNAFSLLMKTRGGSTPTPVTTIQQSPPSPQLTATTTSNSEKKNFNLKSLICYLIGIDTIQFPKFSLMSMMMFFFIYVFTMTRDTKDTLIVTNVGAEAIAFLKVYGVMPVSAIFMIWYTYMSNILTKNALFYATLIPFFVFYGVFAFVLYPMRDMLVIDSLTPIEGTSMFYPMKLTKCWIYSLYFVVSELWGVCGVPLLFWTFANDVTPMSQAKKFYPLFALLGNFAPIASGYTMTYIGLLVSKMTGGEKNFELTIKLLSSTMILSGLLLSFLHMAVRNIPAEITTTSSTSAPPVKKKKAKLSMADSFKLLSKSSYLGYIATMVLSYGLSIEFTELIWKSTAKSVFPNPEDYMHFTATYSKLLGVSTLSMLLIGSKVIKYLGWSIGAIATPLIMGILAVPFFLFIIFGMQGAGGDTLSSSTTLKTALIIGTLQNLFSKSAKYALFDPTKEMAYIPLDDESKVKGKAAIDVLGARMGKSLGALLQQFLIIYVGPLMQCAPILAGGFYVVLAAWILAVKRLTPMFLEKTSNLN